MPATLLARSSVHDRLTADDTRPRVLFATPECAPWIKTGGLGDVSADLPAALGRLGVDVRVLMPAYRQVLSQATQARALTALPGRAELPAARLLEATLPSGVPALLIDCPSLYDRDGGPYQDDERVDWPDNARRFGLLSHVAALLSGPCSPLAWRPHVLHCNDWHAALAPAYLQEVDPGERARTLVAVHNMAFQGLFDAAEADPLGLAPAARGTDGAEFWGRLSFLKAGLFFSDTIVTVSASYAEEIQHEPLGCGLSGLLAARRGVLHGIRNGIDTRLWDPSADPHLAARYDVASLERKAANKAAVQAWAGLAQDPDMPLFGLVSRLTEQKGIDVVIEAAARLAALPCQLVVLGMGTPALEAGLREVDRAHAGSIRAHVGFSEALAHRIEAGVDAFLMPSRFEPCGLNQMFAQRYGTPPVVRATGGLRDTVVDCTPQTLADGTATGFAFATLDADALVGAVQRAIDAWHQPATWRRLQRNGMRKDFGWSASARRYAELYEGLSGVRLPAPEQTADAPVTARPQARARA